MVDGFCGQGFRALGVYKGSTKDSKEDVCLYVTTVTGGKIQYLLAFVFGLRQLFLSSSSLVSVGKGYGLQTLIWGARLKYRV